MKLCQLMDLRNLPRDLLKLTHVIHLLSQNLSVICWPTILNGNVRIYPMFNNPLCKKKFDCIRWRNSCDVFGPFQEACVKKAEIDINIYL